MLSISIYVTNSKSTNESENKTRRIIDSGKKYREDIVKILRLNNSNYSYCGYLKYITDPMHNNIKTIDWLTKKPELKSEKKFIKESLKNYEISNYFKTL